MPSRTGLRADEHLGGRDIEWRLLHGRPFAAIIRIFTIAADENPLAQIPVAKVTSAGGCEIARINGLNSNACRMARGRAD